MIENSGRPHAVDALVFDAYGTLFDVHSVAATRRSAFPRPRRGACRNFGARKQLEYTWLQSLMQSPTQPARGLRRGHRACARLRAAALALAAATRMRRHRLLDAYLDAVAVPRRGADAGGTGAAPALILSNGTRAMLEPLAAATGLARHLDGVLSVDDAGVYKPSPRVYQLAVDALRVSAGPHRLCVVELLGRDRRQGIRIHGVLDQPLGCSRRSPRAGAGSHDRAPWPICLRCSPAA